MKTGIALVAFLLATTTVFSQKVVVVMGSSTAAGSGASTYDSAWVGRLAKYFRQNTSPGNPDTVVQNLGYFGATTYQEMPTGFVSTVPNRPPPNTDINVTKALSFNPDVIIINLPNNDIVNLVSPSATPAEVMQNFRLMYRTITDAGVRCFIATSQPRNDINTTSNFYQRQQLRALVDSITNVFGNRSINFWDDLVSTDGLYSLRDDVRDPNSDYHINNIGHRLVFNRVLARNIFAVGAPLPLSLADFSALAENSGVLLQWRTAEEEANASFEVERSANGRDFEKVFARTANGAAQGGSYTWTDRSAQAGKSYYRLKLITPTKTVYSKVVLINRKTKGLAISQVLINGSTLHIDINSQKSGPATIRLLTLSGTVISQQPKNLNSGSNGVDISIASLPAGAYLLSLTAADGSTDVERFSKLQ